MAEGLHRLCFRDCQAFVQFPDLCGQSIDIRLAGAEIVLQVADICLLGRRCSSQIINLCLLGVGSFLQIMDISAVSMDLCLHLIVQVCSLGKFLVQTILFVLEIPVVKIVDGGKIAAL